MGGGGRCGQPHGGSGLAGLWWTECGRGGAPVHGGPGWCAAALGAWPAATARCARAAVPWPAPARWEQRRYGALHAAASVRALSARCGKLTACGGRG